ncbi:MAG: hypothetical protein RJA13_2139 [Bacteroidota bacterium]
MKALKNIFVGFLVSFIGSIPLGYLNVVGYEVYKRFGFSDTVLYLTGVITVEFLVIYLTLVFANQLMGNKKLIQFIEGFSVLFMFFLAYVFFESSSNDSSQESVLDKYIDYSPYIVGLKRCANSNVGIKSMTTERHIKLGRQTALISFLIGTCIFGLYVLTSSFQLLFVGYGFIALTGIVVNDAIVFIDRANNNMKR